MQILKRNRELRKIKKHKMKFKHSADSFNSKLNTTKEKLVNWK